MSKTHHPLDRPKGWSVCAARTYGTMLWIFWGAGIEWLNALSDMNSINFSESGLFFIDLVCSGIIYLVVFYGFALFVNSGKFLDSFDGKFFVSVGVLCFYHYGRRDIFYQRCHKPTRIRRRSHFLGGDRGGRHDDRAHRNPDGPHPVLASWSEEKMPVARPELDARSMGVAFACQGSRAVEPS